MPEGQSAGDSGQPLTVHDAAPLFEAMFAGENADTEQQPSDTPSKDAPPAKKQDKPAEPAEPEEAESEDEPVETEEDDAEDQQPDEDEAKSEDDEEVEPEPEQPTEPAKHKVKVRGEEIEVTLDEALKGYSRTQDYTRDKQKLADDRRAFDSEKESVTAKAQEYSAKLAALDEALKAQEMPEPDWDALRTADPDLFVQARAQYSLQKERRALVKAEREKVERELAEKNLAKQQTRLQDEQKLLLEKVPEFADPKTGQQALRDLFDYGQTQGFTPQQLANIDDHRAMLLLRKAMLYDKAQETAATKKEIAQRKIEKVKTAKPGSAVKKSKPSALQQSAQRLKRTGSVHDAAKTFELMFGD